ncbi:MAG TPA: F0F1 ATP synthase subunit A [Candidatus Coprenecus pullistercoris]|nr:F0F1 ATP synthase subunit A [Candidatus Coprenecus pullistercoris]
MRRLIYILSLSVSVLASVLPVSAVEKTEADGQKFGAKAVVLEHFEDSYWWHVGTFGTKEVNLYLPVILYSGNTGWHCFSSKHLMDGASYLGFSVASEGRYEGKIVEVHPDGDVSRPFDMSITRTVAALLLNSAIVLVFVLTAARLHRRCGARKTPGGLAAFMEWAVEAVENDLIKPSVGENWRRFAPYLLTVFFFILVNNFMSLIPFFPGGVNVTGNIAVTFVLALASFVAINLFGGRAYWKDIFWPEVPTWLKVPVPFMPVIEFIGIFTKPFALMIRLFANMLAGHAAIICLVCIIFVTASMGALMNTSMTVVAVLFAIFMNALEVLVAFLQAYVFTMLSGVFIGLAQEGKKDRKTISETNNN